MNDVIFVSKVTKRGARRRTSVVNFLHIFNTFPYSALLLHLVVCKFINVFFAMNWPNVHCVSTV